MKPYVEYVCVVSFRRRICFDDVTLRVETAVPNLGSNGSTA
jgi:hypothetical protein